MAILLLLALFAVAAAPAQEADLQDLLKQGLEAYEAGDLQKARTIWTEGLQSAEARGDELFSGSFHGNLGIIHSVTGDYETATEHLEKSLEMARKAGDRQGLKNRLNNAGSLYLLMGQPDQALERFGEALEIARTLGDKNLEAVVLNNIGEAYLKMDDPVEAVRGFRQALAITDPESKAELEIKILSNLGLAYGEMGNYAQAINHFRTAITRAQRGEDGPQKSAALIRDYNRMGILVRDLGDPAGAVAFHQAAVEQAETSGANREREVSANLLAEARALIDGKQETLKRLHLEGLERMRDRLLAHDLEELAAAVEKQIAKARTTTAGRATSPEMPRPAEDPSADSDASAPEPADDPHGLPLTPAGQAEAPKLATLVQLEKKLAQAGSMQEVADRLNELAAADPDNPTILYALGKNYDAMAQRAFDRLREHSDSAYWQRMAGTRLLEARKYDEAQPFLERAAELAPELRGVHAALAQVYDHGGQREKVLHALSSERAHGQLDCATEPIPCAMEAGARLASKHDSPKGYYWQLQAYSELAQQSFARLLELPPAVEAYVHRAELERQGNRHQASVEWWKKALELAPRDPKLRTELAVSYFLARNYVAARPVVEELLELSPESGQLNYLEGEILLYLQRPEEAIPFLERAVAIQPDDLYARAALARGLLQAGRDADAVPHLEKALPLDDDGSLHYQLARAYRAAGQRELALDFLKKYRELKNAYDERQSQSSANPPPD